MWVCFYLRRDLREFSVSGGTFLNLDYFLSCKATRSVWSAATWRRFSIPLCVLQVDFCDLMIRRFACH